MRLESVAAALAEKLRNASVTQQRTAAILVAGIALKTAPVDDPDVTSALHQLDIEGIISVELMAKFGRLIDQFDDEHFKLIESDDPTDHAKAMESFSRARAISALAFAASENPIAAAMEAIYEASVTMDDPNLIFDIACFVL